MKLDKTVQNPRKIQTPLLNTMQFRRLEEAPIEHFYPSSQRINVPIETLVSLVKELRQADKDKITAFDLSSIISFGAPLVTGGFNGILGINGSVFKTIFAAGLLITLFNIVKKYNASRGHYIKDEASLLGQLLSASRHGQTKFINKKKPSLSSKLEKWFKSKMDL